MDNNELSKTRSNSKLSKHKKQNKIVYRITNSIKKLEHQCAPALLFVLCFIFTVVYYIRLLVKLKSPGNDTKSNEGVLRMRVLLFFELVFVLFISLLIMWIIISLCIHNHKVMAWGLSILFSFGWPAFQLTRTH